MGFDHEAIALSVGVQKMGRSDRARRARNRLDQSDADALLRTTLSVVDVEAELMTRRHAAE
jgi:hypothetical protein